MFASWMSDIWQGYLDFENVLKCSFYIIKTPPKLKKVLKIQKPLKKKANPNNHLEGYNGWYLGIEMADF